LLKYDSPKWFRAVQIRSGLVSLILSSLVLLLGFPTVSADVIVTVLAVALLSIGIERILLGLLVSRSTSDPTSGHAKKNLDIYRFLLEFELRANLNPSDSTVYLTKQKCSK
jgi:hypothetical protein